MGSHIGGNGPVDFIKELEQARSDMERASSASMEASHIMEGILNNMMSIGGKLMGLLAGFLGSCSGCAGM